MLLVCGWAWQALGSGVEMIHWIKDKNTDLWCSDRLVLVLILVLVLVLDGEGADGQEVTTTWSGCAKGMVEQR